VPFERSRKGVMSATELLAPYERHQHTQATDRAASITDRCKFNFLILENSMKNFNVNISQVTTIMAAPKMKLSSTEKRKLIIAKAISTTIDSTDDRKYFKLPSGAVVTIEFLESVLIQATKRIPKLTANKKYTARKICGKEFWDEFSSWEAILAGQIISYLTDEGLLPLVHAGRTDQNAQLYEVK